MIMNFSNERQAWLTVGEIQPPNQGKNTQLHPFQYAGAVDALNVYNFTLSSVLKMNVHVQVYKLRIIIPNL